MALTFLCLGGTASIGNQMENNISHEYLEKNYQYNSCVDPYACWDFADNASQQNVTYQTIENSYADDYEIWLWHYEYCLDGLWAPAVLIGC